jgi:hypothetical protein
VTLVVAGLIVRKHTGAFVPLATAARVLLALGLFYVAGGLAPRFGRLVTPIAAVVVVAAYLVFLVLTRELGSADLAMVRAIVKRKR